MLKSKVHRATVTQADLHYVGSVTVDADLMDAADLLEGEQVTIVDIDNGARLETYVITGPRGSGVIGINGAAARLVHPGDLVILISYAVVTDAEARTLRPRVVFVDAANRITGTSADAADVLPHDPASLRGDLVILISYAVVTDAEARTLRPRVVFVDAANRVTGTSTDAADALPHDPASLRGDLVHAGVPGGTPAGARDRHRPADPRRAAPPAPAD